jgi:hypothetical protein
MDNLTIRFPVVCPDCGKDHLAEFPIAKILDALIKNEKIYLRSTCHNAGWVASDSELEQLREYVSVSSLKVARV